MDYKEKIPMVVYDNRCYLCAKFAKIIDYFSRGRISIIGHYSRLGQITREEILDDSALEMFWFVDEKCAFGGRAALFPLLKAMITQKRRQATPIDVECTCDYDCKTGKDILIRTASLLSNSKTIKINPKDHKSK